MKKSAGLYIRVSTEHQALEGYSIAAQKENLMRFARDNDFSIYDTYSDEGISGKSIVGRPEVQRLIEDIKQKKIDIVLIYKFDRLTRNITDTEEFIQLFQKYDTDVWSISDGKVDIENSNGRFMTLLKGLFAQHERELTAERIKVAFIQKVKEGYSLCSATPSYGYNRKKGCKTIVINEKEATVVKRIFNMYLENYSYTKIATILNDEKIPTKKFGIKMQKKDLNGAKTEQTITSIWQPKMIRLILENPTYIGKVRYGIGTKEYFEQTGKHQAIIPLEIWNQVQEKQLKMRRISKTNLPKTDAYFCGSLTCGSCNQKLTTNRTRGRIRKDHTRKYFNGYRCPNREKKSCNAIGMSHKKVERAFVEFLKTISDLTVISSYHLDDYKKMESASNYSKESLERILKKKKEIMNLFMISAITKEQFSFMISKLDEKQKYYEEELEKQKEVQENFTKIDKRSISPQIFVHWTYLTDNEKFAFLSEFVKEIKVINSSFDRQNSEVKILEVKFYDFKK